MSTIRMFAMLCLVVVPVLACDITLTHEEEIKLRAMMPFLQWESDACFGDVHGSLISFYSCVCGWSECDGSHLEVSGNKIGGTCKLLPSSIAILVIGSLIGLVCIIACAWCCCCKGAGCTSTPLCKGGCCCASKTEQVTYVVTAAPVGASDPTHIPSQYPPSQYPPAQGVPVQQEAPMKQC